MSDPKKKSLSRHCVQGYVKSSIKKSSEIGLLIFFDWNFSYCFNVGFFCRKLPNATLNKEKYLLWNLIVQMVIESLASFSLSDKKWMYTWKVVSEKKTIAVVEMCIEFPKPKEINQFFFCIRIIFFSQYSI